MWKMNRLRLPSWIVILVFSLVLIILRTQRFGWFQGKDAVLWLVFGLAAFQSVREFQKR
jgi:hypothetical protein